MKATALWNVGGFGVDGLKYNHYKMFMFMLYNYAYIYREREQGDCMYMCWLCICRIISIILYLKMNTIHNCNMLFTHSVIM